MQILYKYKCTDTDTNNIYPDYLLETYLNKRDKHPILILTKVSI